MSRSYVKVIFQRVQEANDFLLGIVGSEIPSLMASFTSLLFNHFLNSYMLQ